MRESLDVGGDPIAMLPHFFEALFCGVARDAAFPDQQRDRVCQLSKTPFAAAHPDLIFSNPRTVRKELADQKNQDHQECEECPFQECKSNSLPKVGFPMQDDRASRERRFAKLPPFQINRGFVFSKQQPFFPWSGKSRNSPETDRAGLQNGT